VTESQLNDRADRLLKEAASEDRKWDSFLDMMPQELREKLGEDWQGGTESERSLKERRT
jgi:hypothetical protein